MGREDDFLIQTQEQDGGAIERRSSKWSLMLAVVTTAVVSVIATLGIQDAYAPSYALPKLSEPPLGTTIRTFSFEKIYAAKPNRTTKEAWSSLIPNGKGFISAPKLARIGALPHDIWDTPTGTGNHEGLWSVSVFHQLHCLWMLYDSYHKALGIHEHNIEHVGHCFEYLRNSIICAADSTLEPWREEIKGVDGFGNKHHCRKFEAVKAWAEEFRAWDAYGI